MVAYLLFIIISAVFVQHTTCEGPTGVSVSTYYQPINKDMFIPTIESLKSSHLSVSLEVSGYCMCSTRGVLG